MIHVRLRASGPYSSINVSAKYERHDIATIGYSVVQQLLPSSTRNTWLASSFSFIVVSSPFGSRLARWLVSLVTSKQTYLAELFPILPQLSLIWWSVFWLLLSAPKYLFAANRWWLSKRKWKLKLLECPLSCLSLSWERTKHLPPKGEHSCEEHWEWWWWW